MSDHQEEQVAVLREAMADARVARRKYERYERGARRLVAEVWGLVDQLIISSRHPAADAALDLRDDIDPNWFPSTEDNLMNQWESPLRSSLGRLKSVTLGRTQVVVDFESYEDAEAAWKEIGEMSKAMKLRGPIPGPGDDTVEEMLR
jgi:hypothetical protein